MGGGCDCGMSWGVVVNFGMVNCGVVAGEGEGEGEGFRSTGVSASVVLCPGKWRQE